MQVTIHTGSKNENNQDLFNAVIELQLPAKPGHEKPPLHIALALDLSSSMDGEKLVYAKMAAENFIRWMNRRDSFSLVTYATEAAVAFPTSPLADKETLIHELRVQEASGNTNLSGGYLEAVKQLLTAKTPGAVSRVILLTDGQANHGVTDLRQLSKLVSKYQGEGISLSCIGVGRDFDGVLLKALADAGMGNFHFIATADEAPDIFFQEFGDLAGLAAQNARCELEFSANLQIEESFQAIDLIGSNKYAMKLGDMLHGRTYRLPLVLKAEAGERRVNVSSEYFDLAALEFVKHQATLSLAEDQADGVRRNEVDTEITLARIEKLCLEVAASAERGETGEALSQLSAAAEILAKLASRDDARIAALAAKIERLREGLEHNETELVQKQASTNTQITAHFSPSGRIIVKAFDADERLEMSVSRRFRDSIEHIYADKGRHSLIIDLANVVYIDSSGLGCLVTLLRNYRNRQCLMVLAAPNPSVHTLLRLSKLDSFFQVFESVDTARDYIEKEAEKI